MLEWSRLCQHLSTFAATKLGAIAARQLKIPAHLEEALTLQAQTREVYDLESRSSGLNFDGIGDIGDALERAALQGSLVGKELLTIATTLAGARNLRRIVDNYPELEVLNALVQDLRTYPEIEQDIHHCIDDHGEVMDRASQKLAGIRDQLRQVRDRVYSLLHNILQRKAGAVQESVITQRGGRFVIPVKAPQKDAIPGIVHDASTSGATLYIEPHQTVNLNNQLRQLQRQEDTEEEAIRRSLTEKVAAVKPDLERLLAIATTLDLAAARARYSLWLGANPPRFIAASESITLRKLRHPLLIWQQQHEQGNPVVPIDLVMQPYLRVIAITGPNTGGKTVTLKTIGMAMLMAKVGLFVPAREPVELPWFDHILADIGDEQSLQQSLSTFSGHIRRISRILAALKEQGVEEEEQEQENNQQFPVPRSALRTPHSTLDIPNMKPDTRHPAPARPLSLVLLDEVGAGTDPSEGSALAISLLKYLADHAALTIATTHFGELKALKYQDERFENASVEFDDVSLSPTYRLLWGIPGRSNALTIAQRLGLSIEIIQQAKTYVGGASQEINDVIAGLEAQRRRQETKSQDAEELLKQAERLYSEVSQKAASLQERERSLQVAQEQAVQAAIAEAKREVAQVIRHLQKGPTAQAAQRATDSLNQLGEQHLPSRQVKSQPKTGFQPKVGDRIRIPRLDQTAEVLTASNDANELTVRFGLMKMTVALADIESLNGEKTISEEKPTAKKQEAAGKDKPETLSRSVSEGVAPKPETSPTPLIRTSHNTLDIRGSRVADAEPAIDKALSGSQTALWIIHGHGTGKLRQGVQAFLQQHPLVDRYELASREDGGVGVTVAYLK